MELGGLGSYLGTRWYYRPIDLLHGLLVHTLVVDDIGGTSILGRGGTEHEQLFSNQSDTVVYVT